MGEIREKTGDMLEAIGSRLKDRRMERGLSQQQISELAAIDRAYLSLVERGKQNVSVGALVKITTALELPMGKVFEGL